MKPLAKCRDCGTLITKADLIKTWDCTPRAKAGEVKVFISLWKCPNCEKKFRTADRVWPKEKGKLQAIMDRLKK
ncbi:hypothetical protein G4O51_10515 [Candidatus Bathyarchaeota archaeon A05DMB-2]|nr:hypothetical protein [Candidatus Bathyarchaeota archaeon A05DMB-2]